MKRKSFLLMVKDELETIKQKATIDEINKLDFSKFNHTNLCNCIYGQMTGHCNSTRAMEIFEKTFYNVCSTDDDDDFKKYVAFKNHDFTKGHTCTALEKFLFMISAENHLLLIRYLKDEIKIINLNKMLNN